MKKIYFFIVISCYFKPFLVAQDLHVYYNVFTDSTWYEKEGHPVKDPELRKGKKIVLHLEEYNNYIFTSNFQIQQLSYKPVIMDNNQLDRPLNILNAFSDFTQSSISQIPLLSGTLFGSLFKSFSSIRSETVPRSDISTLDDLKVNLNYAEEQIVQINAIVKEINQRQQRKFLLDKGLQEMDGMLLNPNIKPSIIRNFLLSYYLELFGIQTTKELVNQDLIKMSQDISAISDLQLDLKDKIESFKLKIKDIYKAQKQLKLTDFGNSPLTNALKQLQQEEGQLTKSTVLIEIYSQVQGEIKNRDYYNQLLALYLKYLEVKGNEFKQSFVVDASAAYIVLNLNLIRNDSLQTFGNTINGKLTKNRSLNLLVRTYGDFKVSTSVGMSVMQMDKTPQTYFLNNGLIMSQNQERFIPLFNSLIHLAYHFNSPVIPCLSIGAGVPVSSQELQNGLNYFLGGGLVFGRSAKLQLNFGLVYTKILKLSKGLHVGDPLQIADGSIPTEFKYDKGYFLGISFSLN